MSKPIRFASAASVVAFASILAGCATPQGSGIREAKALGEVGLATRAMAALNASDPATAIPLAERAVEKTVDDAGLRALLGNAYFLGGRFASAEAAFKDSLALYSNQPQVVLKLVLVQIAQGKHAEAAQYLDAARSQLDPADYGLAMALAGRVPEAIAVLETAARAPNADSRVRQNLALALAFAGDWVNARTVAAQDVSADQLDARIEQWMQLAKPKRTFDQVAALTGVTPAAADPGQPVGLALRKGETQVAQVAQVAPQASPAPVAPAQAESQPQPEFAAAPPPEPQFAEAAPPAPVYESAPDPQREPATVTMAMAAAAAPEAPAAFAAFAPKLAKAKPVKAKAARASAPVRKAALRRGGSNVVVQLGSYRSPQYVATAWDTLTKRHPALREYLPMRARFDSPKGTYWRLSIQGFASQREAIERCQLLKSRGGSCFVRTVAGDAPVQIASR